MLCANPRYDSTTSYLDFPLYVSTSLARVVRVLENHSPSPISFITGCNISSSFDVFWTSLSQSLTSPTISTPGIPHNIVPKQYSKYFWTEAINIICELISWSLVVVVKSACITSTYPGVLIFLLIP